MLWHQSYFYKCSSPNQAYTPSCLCIIDHSLSVAILYSTNHRCIFEQLGKLKDLHNSCFKLKKSLHQCLMASFPWMSITQACLCHTLVVLDLQIKCTGGNIFVLFNPNYLKYIWQVENWYRYHTYSLSHK